jgi:hypothetical protein
MWYLIITICSVSWCPTFWPENKYENFSKILKGSTVEIRISVHFFSFDRISDLEKCKLTHSYFHIWPPWVWKGNLAGNQAFPQHFQTNQHEQSNPVKNLDIDTANADKDLCDVIYIILVFCFAASRFWYIVNL